MYRKETKAFVLRLQTAPSLVVFIAYYITSHVHLFHVHACTTGIFLVIALALPTKLSSQLGAVSCTCNSEKHEINPVNWIRTQNCASALHLLYSLSYQANWELLTCRSEKPEINPR